MGWEGLCYISEWKAGNLFSQQLLWQFQQLVDTKLKGNHHRSCHCRFSLLSHRAARALQCYPRENSQLNTKNHLGTLVLHLPVHLHLSLHARLPQRRGKLRLCSSLAPRLRRSPCRQEPVAGCVRTCWALGEAGTPCTANFAVAEQPRCKDRPWRDGLFFVHHCSPCSLLFCPNSAGGPGVSVDAERETGTLSQASLWEKL